MRWFNKPNSHPPLNRFSAFAANALSPSYQYAAIVLTPSKFPSPLRPYTPSRIASRRSIVFTSATSLRLRPLHVCDLHLESPFAFPSDFDRRRLPKRVVLLHAVELRCSRQLV